MEPLLTSITINTCHLQGVLQFFTRLGFEFQVKKVSKGGECHKTFVGGVEFILFSISGTNRAVTPDLQLSFGVSDLDKMVADLSQIENVQVILDPTLLPGGLKAIVLDPDGRAVELIETSTIG